MGGTREGGRTEVEGWRVRGMDGKVAGVQKRGAWACGWIDGWKRGRGGCVSTPPRLVASHLLDYLPPIVADMPMS